MQKLTKKSGFTIVELLVVILVIAILAIITVVSYNYVRSTAQSAAVATALKTVESSMRSWMTEQKMNEWPIDPIGGGGVPLSQMIEENPGLRKHLDKIPSVQGVQQSEWFYDNERDRKNECNYTYSGVNIVIHNAPQEVIQEVDDAIDDGNLTCGKVRYENGHLFYALSYHYREM